MRVVAEFTTEPFKGEGEPPAHARRAWEVVQASGLEGDFGPLGTEIAGDRAPVLVALHEVMTVALDAGATRLTLQLQSGDLTAEPTDRTDQQLLAAVRPLVERIGARFVDAADVTGTDVPLAWRGSVVAGVRFDGPADETRPSGGDDSTIGLTGILADVQREFSMPLVLLPRSEKQRAVRLLEEAGAFSYRKSVETIAAALGVSRFTVYNYLNRDRG